MFRRSVEHWHAAEVVPPRGLEDGIAAARGMLSALAGEEVALEVVTTAEGPRWHVRAPDAAVLDRALAELRTAYPQALIELAPSAARALVPQGGHEVTVDLRPAADTALPIRADWRDERDPLAGVLAAAATAGDASVCCRLVLGPASQRAARGIRRRQDEPGLANRRVSDVPGPSLIPLVILLLLLAGWLQAWRWYEEQAWAALAATAASGFIVLPVLAAVAVRWLRRPDLLGTRTVETKLEGPLLAAHLAVTVRGPNRRRCRTVALRVAAAYAAYDDGVGGGLRPVAPRRGRQAVPRRLPLLLNAAEVAALWHLPDALGTPAQVRRTTAQRLSPAPPRLAAAPRPGDRGVQLGTAPLGMGEAPVLLPVPLLYRNHLIVAKTRRGKSTLLRHLAAGFMERAATGVDDAALVVVDPHQDLAEAVLASVPGALSDRVTYLDFARPDRPIGLNLIDVELFRDRDRTVEHIVTMLNRLWPANWGPRMEGALRASLASLIEANRRRPREGQFTLLDVAPFLTGEEWRKELLAEVEDPAILAWWRDNYDRAGTVLQQQTANPVTSKIGRFTVTEASRLVLGQACSTFDPRAVIREGGVLVVNTSVGTLGEGAAALVGATMLNLLGLLVEEQVALPPERRRRVTVLVDESSTLGAVDYPRMLSELGKYGANFVLVTQSLSKLDAVDRELVPTILANCDGLTVFQVSADDAARLLPELGSGLEVEDLVSLDDFTCYARWWDGFARPAAFTLRVDPPPVLDAAAVESIAVRSGERTGRPREEVVAEVTRALAARMRDLPERPQRRRARSKHTKATASSAAGPTGSPPQSVDPGGGQ